MNQQLDNTKKVDEQGAAVTSAYDWIGAAVIALVVVSLVFSLFCRVVNVSGDSMKNTFHDGEKLLLSGVVTPDYGDVVVLRRDNDTPLIKRVIGLPGDVIAIREGVVYRNGEALDEPYTMDGFTDNKQLKTAYTVPKGGIFVLGDNRIGSEDSRYYKDALTMSDVVGVITFRLNPFEYLGDGE